MSNDLDLSLGQPTLFTTSTRCPTYAGCTRVQDVNNTYLVQPDDPQLIHFKTLLRQLHDLYPVIDLPDCHIIVGCGTTQLLGAFLWALNKHLTGGLSQIALQLPGPSFLYNNIAQVSLPVAQVGDFPQAPLEIIVRPNNPDGQLLQASTPAPYRIYDMVYAWPMYVSEPSWQ